MKNYIFILLIQIRSYLQLHFRWKRNSKPDQETSVHQQPTALLHLVFLPVPPFAAMGCVRPEGAVGCNRLLHGWPSPYFHTHGWDSRRSQLARDGHLALGRDTLLGPHLSFMTLIATVPRPGFIVPAKVKCRSVGRKSQDTSWENRTKASLPLCCCRPGCLFQGRCGW